MSFDKMRITAMGKNSPLSDVVLKALQEGELNVTNLRAPGFRALAPLTDRAQVVIDKAVVEVGMQRLTFVADLLAEGLTYNLTDPLSVTQIEWNKTNRVGAAQRVMTPSSRTENKLPNVLSSRLPIYLTTDGFELDIRTLKMSQRIGTPLDVSLVQQCTRAVNEAFEDAALNGATTLDGLDLNVAGYTAPGLLNAPDANLYPLSVDWTGANTIGTTGPAMAADLLGMIDALQADFKYGPYNLYVGTKTMNLMQGDFKVNTTDTIQKRLEMIQAGGRPIKFRSADLYPAAAVGKQATLVQMTNDVVDIVVGQPPTVIPWTSLDGFTIHNIVMGIMIPRVRSDYNGNSGIVHGTRA